MRRSDENTCRNVASVNCVACKKQGAVSKRGKTSMKSPMYVSYGL